MPDSVSYSTLLRRHRVTIFLAFLGLLGVPLVPIYMAFTMHGPTPILILLAALLLLLSALGAVWVLHTAPPAPATGRSAKFCTTAAWEGDTLVLTTMTKYLLPIKICALLWSNCILILTFQANADQLWQPLDGDALKSLIILNVALALLPQREHVVRLRPDYYELERRKRNETVVHYSAVGPVIYVRYFSFFLVHFNDGAVLRKLHLIIPRLTNANHLEVTHWLITGRLPKGGIAGRYPHPTQTTHTMN